MGGDIVNTQDTQELGELVVRHIARVREDVRDCESATFVVNVESNMAGWASSVENYMKRANIPNYEFMREDVRSKGRGPGGEAEVTAGTRTTKENKPEMIQKLGRLLRNGQVRCT